MLFKHLKNNNGSAIVEIAIVLPVFVFILIAIVDFGLFFNKRNVAQSAAYNAAKECASANAEDPSRVATLNKTSNMGITLESMDLYDSVNMDTAPSCSDQGTYYQVDVRIRGAMMSPFTSALGLYNSGQGFLVTGIASK